MSGIVFSRLVDVLIDVNICKSVYIPFSRLELIKPCFPYVNVHVGFNVGNNWNGIAITALNI